MVALRASFEVLRNLAPNDDDESGDSFTSTEGDDAAPTRPPSNFVPASMLKELVTKVWNDPRATRGSRDVLVYRGDRSLSVRVFVHPSSILNPSFVLGFPNVAMKFALQQLSPHNGLVYIKP